MRATTGAKGETTGRIARFMVADGIVERRLVQIKTEKGHNKLVIQYRLKREQPTTPMHVDGQTVNVPGLL